MRRLAFTICSNNFLSQATTLADSLLAKNPDYEVVIGLADKRSEAIDYSRFRPCRIVSIDELNIPNLPWMISNYNIVELNTAVKPYFFEFLFGQHDVSHILYFDPDIQVYDALDALTDHFQNHDILLTPHVILPIPKDVYPWENHFLKHGVYNLGFIGLKNTANVHSLLNWWQARTAEHCLADFRKGLYVDQLWANFIPLFFEKVAVIKHPGMNVAFWNLHERRITYIDGKYVVNGYPLIFFHFSAFDPNSPELLTKEDYSNFDQNSMPDLRGLVTQYQKALISHNYEFFSQQAFAYSRESEIKSEIDQVTRRIARTEVILGFLRLLLINKERLVSNIYQLFADYIKYNNLKLRNVNDNRYNSLEYAYRVRRNVHSKLERDIIGGPFARFKLFFWSFKSLWK